MKAGTVVTCPDCDAEQLVTTVDLEPGQRLSEAGFKSLGFDVHNSQRAGCHRCGALWYRKHPKTGRSQIHTQLDKWLALGEPTKNETQIIKLPAPKIIH